MCCSIHTVLLTSLVDLSAAVRLVRDQNVTSSTVGNASVSVRNGLCNMGGGQGMKKLVLGHSIGKEELDWKQIGHFTGKCYLIIYR